MSDIISIIKGYAGPISRFLKTQFHIWISVVLNPLNYISSIDMKSKEIFLPTLGFCLFIYIMSIFIAATRLYAYGGIDFFDIRFLVMDFTLTLLCFSLVGFTMYGVGKVFGGKGSFQECFLSGLYVCAFWPLLQIFDYLLHPSLDIFDKHQLAILRLVVFLFFTTLIVSFLTYKIYPVFGYIHRFGKARAIIATLIQLMLASFLMLIFLVGFFKGLIPSA